MKWFLAALFALFATSVFAAKLTLTTVVSDETGAVSGGNVFWDRMGDADVAFVRNRAVSVTAVADKMQNQGGPFTVKLTEDLDGKANDLTYTGVTAKGVDRILDAEEVFGRQLRQELKKHIAKGGKRQPWGKDKK